jgi:flagellar M-ring protein FliF
LNRHILQQLKLVLERLTLGQKIALASITSLTLVGLIFLLAWANRPEYGLLYSSLDAVDASAIVEDLKSNNIPYKLKDAGKTILVPSKDIYELRIKFAGQKLISSGAVGYELFDKNNLGLTDFMQKINLKRALEGELSKTINQIEAIQQSRVHLVLPEPALFEEEENKATASVIVKLRANARLESKQIVGISYMVAGGVEGLSPENVTIVDTYGNILNGAGTQDRDLGISSSQFELKQKVERYLSQKAQGMLDGVLGKGNSIVKVSAELNFKKVRRTTESFDPDNTAILSEERNEERSSREDTTLFQRENVVTNYELNKIVEEFEDSVGDIERLTIAVFVNSMNQTEQQAPAYSEEDINKITEIVKLAVGFDPNRNDKIVVDQVAFDRSFIDQEKEAIEAFENKEFRLELLRIGLIVIGSIFILLVLRGFFKKFGGDEFMTLQTSKLLGSPRGVPETLIGEGGESHVLEDLYLRKLSPEAKAKLKEKEKITNEVKVFTESEPEQATSLLRYWLMEK